MSLHIQMPAASGTCGSLSAWAESPSPPLTRPPAPASLVPPLRKNSSSGSQLKAVKEAPANAPNRASPAHDFLKIEVNKRHAILPQAKAWLDTNPPGSPGGSQQVPLRPAGTSTSATPASREHALVLTLPAPEQEWTSSRPPRRASPRKAKTSDISQIPQRGNTPGASSRARESACSIHDCGRSSFSCSVMSHSQTVPSTIVPLASAKPPSVPGGPAKLNFGDPYHHVDAPRSPIKGSKPQQTPKSHINTPGSFGQLGAYKYDDQTPLFAATPVPPTPPRPPGADYLPDKPSRIRPPNMPAALPEAFTMGQASLDSDLGPVIPPPPPPHPLQQDLDPDMPTQKISNIRSPFPADHPTTSSSCGDLHASCSSASLLHQQQPQSSSHEAQRGMMGSATSSTSSLGRSRSEMALRPLRSVGRFSTAMDPSKVSKWQYTTLQRTQPEAHLTNRAKQYHPDYEVMRINSAASLRLTEAENRLTEAERRLQSEKESLKASMDRTGAAGKAQASNDPASRLDKAADSSSSAATKSAMAGGGGSNNRSGGGGGGVRAAHIDEKSLLMARQKGAAPTREEAAAFIAEAEHYIEFAEQALVHVSPSGTRRISTKPQEKGEKNALGLDPDQATKGMKGRRALGSLPPSAAKEAQPLSREASREGGQPANGGYRKPLYEQEEEEPFPRQLISKLEGVPGVPMQILRLMRRGDWRVRA